MLDQIIKKTRSNIDINQSERDWLVREAAKFHQDLAFKIMNICVVHIYTLGTDFDDYQAVQFIKNLLSIYFTDVEYEKMAHRFVKDNPIDVNEEQIVSQTIQRALVITTFHSPTAHLIAYLLTMQNQKQK